MGVVREPRQYIKKQRHYFANNGTSSQSYGFSSSYVWMWELDHKESWESKKWCFWTVVLEKMLESLLECKEIKPVNPNGNQSWIFIGRTDAEAETPILWPPNTKNWLIWKDPDAGKDWRQEEKGMTEDGWMASLTQWTWVQASSGSWWWTGKPGVQSRGSQRVRHEWVTELTVRKREDSRSPLNFQSDYEWIIMEPFTQTGKKIVSEVFSLYILNLRFHGGGHVNPLQYSCLENPMDRGVWWATSPWGCKESDMTEQLNTHTSLRLLKTPK